MNFPFRTPVDGSIRYAGIGDAFAWNWSDAAMQMVMIADYASPLRGLQHRYRRDCRADDEMGDLVPAPHMMVK
jgi:hypothetical protein